MKEQSLSWADVGYTVSYVVCDEQSCLDCPGLQLLTCPVSISFITFVTLFRLTILNARNSFRVCFFKELT